MSRETATYRDTLAALREKGEARFPGLMLLGPSHVIYLLGRSRSTVYRRRKEYGLTDGFTTYEKLARAISQEPH